MLINSCFNSSRNLKSNLGATSAIELKEQQSGHGTIRTSSRCHICFRSFTRSWYFSTENVDWTLWSVGSFGVNESVHSELTLPKQIYATVFQNRIRLVLVLAFSVRLGVVCLLLSFPFILFGATILYYAVFRKYFIHFGATILWFGNRSSPNSFHHSQATPIRLSNKKWFWLMPTSFD